MTARMLVNGLPGDTVNALDRGLSYGDGLFETIRFIGDSAPLWSRHMHRLDESCRRLQLPEPAALQLLRDACAVAHDMPQSAVRITLTRGMGTRGYAPPVSPQITRVVAAFEPPAMDREVYVEGVRLRVCTTRLAEQPLLAGMKHLNRLEQVLARAEWNDPAIAEGVLCDASGRVISATMANLFAVVNGRLMTPAVDRCGVAGVARAEVLAVYPETEIGDLMLDDLQEASEVFLSSSVRGILPVCSLNGRDYVRGDMTRHLQRHWHDLGFSMEQGG
jgi:4-amino-4-deoxychorismate lyase